MNNELPPRDPLFTTRLTVGLWVMALGAIFLAGNLGWIDAHRTFGLFWPLLLVLAGVNMVARRPLLNPENPGPAMVMARTRRWGLVLITVGSWLFLSKLGWINISLWQVAFPLQTAAVHAQPGRVGDS